MSKLLKGTNYTTFDDCLNDNSLLSPIQRDAINFEISLIGMLIEARVSRGLSQKQLAELTGMKQPAIARLESMKTTPQIDTLFRLLQPLGYTLTIIPSKVCSSHK